MSDTAWAVVGVGGYVLFALVLGVGVGKWIKRRRQRE